MHIESCPKGPTNEEYDGGSTIVSRGEYRGRPVAIKTLRLYITGDFEACFSVSAEFSQILLEIHSHCRVVRNFAEKSLPGGIYITRTSFPLSV